MNATPASLERVQKYVTNFELQRFLKKRPNYPILPYQKPSPLLGPLDLPQRSPVVLGP